MVEPDTIIDGRYKVISRVGSGGMASKVSSARIVTRTGVPAVVAPGREPDVLVRVLAGDDVGTLFTLITKFDLRNLAFTSEF